MENDKNLKLDSHSELENIEIDAVQSTNRQSKKGVKVTTAEITDSSSVPRAKTKSSLSKSKLEPENASATTGNPDQVASKNSAKGKSREARKPTIVVDIGVDNSSDSLISEEGDLEDHRLYLNRELTWLNFNRRVLFEAENEKNPLLDRIKFLAIVSSNTDDFFMKRIGGFKQLIEADFQEMSIDGRTPKQQLKECYAAIKTIENKKTELFDNFRELLRQKDIYLLAYRDLEKKDEKYLRDYFINNIFPLLTPQSVDPAHPFPFISNLSFNLLVKLRQPNSEEFSLARVKVPVGLDIPRFVRIGKEARFVKVEEIIRNNLDLLFPDIVIESTELFRVTRNANTEKDEEQADDLLELIESELRDRKFAPFVRLQVPTDTDSDQLSLLCYNLGLKDSSDVFTIGGMLGKRDLMEIANLDRPALKFAPHQPIDPPRLKGAKNMFKVMRNEGPILLFHPYESFTDSVERFLREASEDPKVRAIKMTLYRTSTETNVINYLIRAAQNGKQVLVVVELKARFDEAANIRWANKLEEMGIHVTYGVVGFKTHAKVILVIRKDFDGLRLYSHIGTGNYHAGTARLYTDFGLLTCDPEIGQDLIELFNFLTTGCTPKRKYNKILMAPATLKKELILKIEREIKLHSPDSPALIQMKLNALEDKDICACLYRASQAGVKVELLVRDTCRIRPGIPGLSENISVRSIIGRFFGTRASLLFSE